MPPRMPSYKDMVLELQLSRDLDELEDAANDFVKSRQAIIKRLNNLAQKLEQHLYRANIAKVVGGSVGIVGSGLAIAGFIASFFTFGISMVLVGVGAVIGLAGGLTTLGCVLTEFITSELTSPSAVKTCKDDEDASKRLQAKLKQVYSIKKRAWNMTKVISGGVAGGKTTHNFVTTVCDLVGEGAAAFDVGTGAETAFLAASVVGQALNIAGLVASIIAIGVNMYTVITSSKYLYEKTVPEIAQVIRKTADDLKAQLRKTVNEIRANNGVAVAQFD